MQPADWWSYQCPACAEVFQADRNELKRSRWWSGPPKVRCPECRREFGEDQAAAMQRYRGKAPVAVAVAPDQRPSYLFHVVTGVVVSVITAVILAALGLRH